jgi:hypothetical protein
VHHHIDLEEEEKERKVRGVCSSLPLTHTPFLLFLSLPPFPHSLLCYISHSYTLPLICLCTLCLPPSPLEFSLLFAICTFCTTLARNPKGYPHSQNLILFSKDYHQQDSERRSRRETGMDRKVRTVLSIARGRWAPFPPACSTLWCTNGASARSPLITEE